ncbi:MAG: hypothetical protein ACRDRY_22310 [Pseudonocardiaceae bacterium]
MIKGASQTTTAAAQQVPDDPEAARKFAFRQAIDANRDQWGRPKIMLPDGRKETGYRRASSYGAPLEDGTLLEKWGKRQVARGIARRGDLGLAVTRAEVGLTGDTEQVREAKRELNDLCEQAMEAVDSSAKATIGTALHDVFELVDLGRDPGHVPDVFVPDLAAYRKLTSTVFRVLSSELFVVQDDHRVAGTLDRAVEVLIPVTTSDGTVIERGSVLIGDVKTSGSMDFAGCKFAVQCWVYATGHPYDPIRKMRTPWLHTPPRTDWAVIFHVASGSGQARLHWVDLTEAAEAAEDARRSHEWRNARGKALITRGSVIEDFTLTCEHAETEFDLMAAYERAKAAGEWNDVLKQRFGRRKAELRAASNGSEAAK